MVIDREREMEKERKFSHSTYKFDQQKKSAIAAAEDDDDACSLRPLSLSPSDGPCRKKRPLSEPEISEIWEQCDGKSDCEFEVAGSRRS